MLLFETGLPTRYYIPKLDVRMDLLEPSDYVTRCPYKGVARHWSARVGDKLVERRITGGLLGHWAVWTKKAVELHAECRRVAQSGKSIPAKLLRTGVEITDANAAFFDAANGYAGCIPGIHEVLRRQGLLEGIWCLDPKETLSPGQLEEIDRVYRAYPHLNDDDFVREGRDAWLKP
jgi:hypothetical protein